MTAYERIQAGVAAAFLVVGVAGLAGTGSTPADVDPKAVAILQAMDDAFAKAEGLIATYTSETFRPTPQGPRSYVEATSLRLGRPNVFDVRTKAGAGERVIASDGKTRFEFSTGTGSTRCTTWDVGPRNEFREITTFNPVYWSFFDLGEWQIRSALLGHWSSKWRLNEPGMRSVRYLGKETVDGVAVDRIEWTYTNGYNKPDDDPVYTSVLSIGPDHLIRRIETTSTGGRPAQAVRIVETIAKIKVTPRPALAEFKVQLPAGAQCTRVDPEAVYTTGKYVDLPVGTIAPDFTLGTARGETFKLSAFLKQHKVVLMNYWGYG
jgi:hypothetical protein